MKRYEIKYLLKEDVSALIGTSICVKGWVRTKRGNKNVAFLAVNDGSIIHNIQVVADGHAIPVTVPPGNSLVFIRKPGPSAPPVVKMATFP